MLLKVGLLEVEEKVIECNVVCNCVSVFGFVSMLLVWKSLMVMVVFWKVVLFGLLIVMLGLSIVGELFCEG